VSAVRLVLDTHALLWWLAGDARLSPAARDAIADETNEVFVSAASAWEVTTKHRLGKLPGAGPLAVDFAREVRRQGFQALPITLEHGQVAGALVSAHRDPFDRMLVAQAREEKMALVSNETVFDAFGVTRVW
jgi:PIN domain nuclease of toxin-antitoxin system